MLRRSIVTVLLISFLGMLSFSVKASIRLQPGDLKYLGAFRLPDTLGGGEDVGWEWSNWAGAATSYPDGDPSGPDDGYPGSIFAVGHDHTQQVSEISVPVPVKSAGKNVAELNTADVLQGFHDIKGDLYGYLEMPRVGLEYLSAQGDQASGKLYFSWAEHLDEGNTGPTHGWCELNLSDPRSQGTWRIGGFVNYVTADYMFEIPSEWADRYTPGYRLATGRYRDGGQGAQGPALFAIAPWNQGNPPAPGTTLSATTLLLYDDVITEGRQHILDNYAHSDEWNGGAWLTSGNKASVIFVGNKGVGYTWYGCVDGQECPPNCDCGESRGWWSDRISAQIIFYDPDDLAKVVRGEVDADTPQPYAVMDIDPFLYHINSTRQKHHVSAVAFDRPHGLLYIFEPFGDGDKPIVHVWKVSGDGGGDTAVVVPGQEQSAVLLTENLVRPGDRLVSVEPESILLRPVLKIPEDDVGQKADLIIYVHVPQTGDGFIFNGSAPVTLSGSLGFSSFFPDAIDLSGASGQVFDIYYGYRLSDGRIGYNAFELAVGYSVPQNRTGD